MRETSTLSAIQRISILPLQYSIWYAADGSPAFKIYEMLLEHSTSVTCKDLWNSMLELKDKQDLLPKKQVLAHFDRRAELLFQRLH